MIHGTVPPEIAALHARYVELSGMDVRLTQAFATMWWQWSSEGYTIDDLDRVLRFLRRKIARGDRQQGALRLSNILDPVRFEEDLAFARAARQPDLPKKAAAAAPPDWAAVTRGLYPDAHLTVWDAVPPEAKARVLAAIAAKNDYPAQETS